MRPSRAEPLLPFAAVLAVIAVLSGCRDLGLTAAPGASAPPEVEFLGPTDGGRVTRTQIVSLQVTALHGVQSVSLACNGLTVRNWGGAPFLADVDFTPCINIAARTGADGGTLAVLNLSATAVDRNNNSGQAGVVVAVDLSAEDATRASLIINAPPRVLPRSPLTFTLTTDRALQVVPVAHVGGSPATVTQVGPSLYTATLAQTPAIGIDAWDGGADADVPLEVLEDVERPLTLAVDAVTLNGNPTHVETQILVSRVAWDRPLPGILCGNGPLFSGRNCEGVPSSVANANGLVVPLLQIGAAPKRTAWGWVPGVFAAADGTFRLEPDTLQDAGFTGEGFTAAGNVVLQSGSGTLLTTPDTATTLATIASPVFNPALHVQPVGAAACQSSSPTVPACGQALTCLADGGSVVATQSGSGFGLQVEVANADTYLAVINPDGGCVCGFCLQTGVTPQLLVGGPGSLNVYNSLPAGTTVNRVFPTDGGFVLDYTTPTASVVRFFDTTSGLVGGGTYFGTTGRQMVAAWPDGRAFTLTLPQPYTQFEAWDVNASQPSAVSRIAGLYLPDVSSPAPTGVAVNANSLSLLVRPSLTGSQRLSLIKFNQAMRPQWIYHLPRTPLAFTDVELVADTSGSALYLIDKLNGYVTALQR